jgi:hypothetical protein
MKAPTKRTNKEDVMTTLILKSRFLDSLRSTGKVVWMILHPVRKIALDLKMKTLNLGLPRSSITLI